MPANALVQTRIDAKVKARAAAVLEEIGMTVSDAVRILLTRTANEGALPFRSIRVEQRTMSGFAPRCARRSQTRVRPSLTTVSRSTLPDAVERQAKRPLVNSCGLSGPCLR